MTPVTVEPKYKVGNILENGHGVLGRVKSVQGTIWWDAKGKATSEVAYEMESGGHTWTMKQATISRVVAEK